MFLNKYFSTLLIASFGFTLFSCSDDKNELVVEDGTITIPAEFKNITVESDDQKASMEFSSTGDWTVGALDGADWIKFNATTRSEGVSLTNSISGKAGDFTLTLWLEENLEKDARIGKIRFISGKNSTDITLTQNGNPKAQGPGEDDKPVTQDIDPSTIPDYDKYFPNSEYGRMALKPNAKFSFANYKSSEHFFVFWDQSFFGNNPSDPALGNDAVDIDDLLAKAEKFFETNITTLGMAELGVGKSYLDKYKMQIYLLDPTPEWWVATGSGYDNTIGALWVTPSTCQPVGSTIAHEIGHSFQYQTYCDKLYQGGTDDGLSGWRYGYNSVNNPLFENTGGCGYWEQCAQWQSFQDYPEEQFTSYNFQEWLNNHHRHFHHEWQRYASYWLQSYWVAKHGVEIYGQLWRESKYPEDAIMAYTRIANNDDWQKTREELFDYAMRMATFDIDYKTITPYAASYQGLYSTSLLKNKEGMYQPTYSNCPGTTGFNVIPLDVPANGGEIKVHFKGLEYGAPLLESDGGMTTAGDGQGSVKVSTYNKNGGADNMGWRYGFVAYENGKRTYSEAGKSAEGELTFNVPAGAKYLYLVVQGSPEKYGADERCAWDEKETTDAQYPYAFSLEGTGVKGMIDVDPSKDPEDITLKIERTYDLANYKDYGLEDIDLLADGTATKLCEAFSLSSAEFASAVQTIGVGITNTPAEGKITFGLLQPDGTIAYTYTANGGFYINEDGSLGSWGENSPVWVEYNPTAFILSLGQYPGQTVADKTYGYKPVFTYVKGGKEYNAVFEVNVTFK